MPDRIRFHHKELSSGQHAITSPDIKGFCIVAATEQDAVSQALEMLALVRRRQEGAARERVMAVEFETA